jgi:hypothetical protein
MSFGEGIVVIDRRILTASATDVTFSDLGSTNPWFYKLLFSIANPGADCQYSVRRNGVLTAGSGVFHFANEPGDAGAGMTFEAAQIAWINVGENGTGEWLLYPIPQPSASGPGTVQQCIGIAASVGPSGNQSSWRFGGRWTGSVGVTSLTVHASIASGLGIGTQLVLLRY